MHNHPDQLDFTSLPRENESRPSFAASSVSPPNSLSLNVPILLVVINETRLAVDAARAELAAALTTTEIGQVNDATRRYNDAAREHLAAQKTLHGEQESQQQAQESREEDALLHYLRLYKHALISHAALHALFPAKIAPPPPRTARSHLSPHSQWIGITPNEPNDLL